MLKRIKLVLKMIFKREISPAIKPSAPEVVNNYAEVNGRRILVNNTASFSVCYKEIFLNENYLFETDNPEPFILDCGANIGLSIIYFKTIYPNAKIIAFEADPDIFKILQYNIIEVFNYSNVTLLNQAIWTYEGEIEFVIEGGLSGKILKIDDPLNPVTKKVSCIDFNTYLKKGKIDFLKIDIEGAETELIKHCENFLANVKRIFMEYHSYSAEPQKLSEILSTLENAGFRYQLKEAFTLKHPYIDGKSILSKRIFDIQLDIFAYKVNI